MRIRLFERWVQVAALVLFASGVGCRSGTEEGPAPRRATGPVALPDAGGPAPKAPEASPDPGPASPQPEGSPQTEPPQADQSAQKPLDKDHLWSCFQQVYCAQKRNEMDKILDIYRSCGFENPADFTAAWVEAAKDTEWVSRLAHEVSKACK